MGSNENFLPTRPARLGAVSQPASLPGARNRNFRPGLGGGFPESQLRSDSAPGSPRAHKALARQAAAGRTRRLQTPGGPPRPCWTRDKQSASLSPSTSTQPRRAQGEIFPLAVAPAQRPSSVPAPQPRTSRWGRISGGSRALQGGRSRLSFVPRRAPERLRCSPRAGHGRPPGTARKSRDLPGSDKRCGCVFLFGTRSHGTSCFGSVIFLKSALYLIYIIYTNTHRDKGQCFSERLMKPAV